MGNTIKKKLSKKKEKRITEKELNKRLKKFNKKDVEEMNKRNQKPRHYVLDKDTIKNRTRSKHSLSYGKRRSRRSRRLRRKN